MFADEGRILCFAAISETNRRRSIQEEYNEVNNIEPKTIVKEIRDVLDTFDDGKSIKSKKRRCTDTCWSDAGTKDCCNEAI